MQVVMCFLEGKPRGHPEQWRDFEAGGFQRGKGCNRKGRGVGQEWRTIPFQRERMRDCSRDGHPRSVRWKSFGFVDEEGKNEEQVPELRKYDRLRERIHRGSKRRDD